MRARLLLRCLVVWLSATAGLAVVLVWVCPFALSLGRGDAWLDFTALLPRACAALLVGCAGWIWVITTVTTAEVALTPGALSLSTTGVVRRWVLILCGVSLMSAPLGVAHADEGPELAAPAPAAISHLIDGLPFPDRVLGAAPAGASVAQPAPIRPRVTPAPTPRTPRPAPARVTVRPGDTLWSLARSSLPPDRRNSADIDRSWRAIYAANRAVIGPDPDLLTPGLSLRLPPL